MLSEVFHDPRNIRWQYRYNVFVARLRAYFVFARLRNCAMVTLRYCALQILKISATKWPSIELD
jgi:hypothetical protein